MKKAKYYVCPQCRNLLLSTSEAAITCCGRSLEPLAPVKAEETLRVELVEDERFITSDHPMTKDHYISFVAFVEGERLTLMKQYPEWDLQVRLPGQCHGVLLWHCTNHGLFYQLL